jgi:hypothetical protein
MSKESRALWNEWLKTEDGRGYGAGWGDYQNQLHAARGHQYVAEKMIASRDARIAQLLAACEAIWPSGEHWRDSLIDEPDEDVTEVTRKIRDAWRTIRDAIAEAKGTTS